MIKLTEGKFYKRNDGKIVGPAHHIPGLKAIVKFSWTLDHMIYMENGHWYDDGRLSDFDIVEEVPSPYEKAVTAARKGHIEVEKGMSLVIDALSETRRQDNEELAASDMTVVQDFIDRTIEAHMEGLVRDAIDGKGPLADKADLELAVMVRALKPEQVNHEAICVAVRDRILKLSHQVAELKSRLRLN